MKRTDLFLDDEKLFIKKVKCCKNKLPVGSLNYNFSFKGGNCYIRTVRRSNDFKSHNNGSSSVMQHGKVLPSLNRDGQIFEIQRRKFSLKCAQPIFDQACFFRNLHKETARKANAQNRIREHSPVVLYLYTNFVIGRTQYNMYNTT